MSKISEEELFQAISKALDIDESLAPAINKTTGDFYFSSNKKIFYNLLKEKIKGQKNKIIVTLLGFSHKISDKHLFNYLT